MTTSRPRVLLNPLFTFSRALIITRAAFVAALLLCHNGSAIAAEPPSLLPAENVSLESFAAFRAPAENWKIVGGIADQARSLKTIGTTPGTGIVVSTPQGKGAGPLVTSWEHGDLALDLEFLLPVGSNSGIYFQGRYEVQLFDSWGVKQPTYSDCGGIYQRWDAARGAGKEGYEGHAPLANASRAPGLWQRLHVEFTAPRFDATGKKVANAKFHRVTLNGFDVQENVEVTGPTRSAMFEDEKATGPLVIQGDHGPVAIRRMTVKRFGNHEVKLADLKVAFFAGDFDAVAEYEGKAPKREATAQSFSDAVVEGDGRGAARFAGSISVPVEGEYAFSVRVTPAARLLIDGKTVFLPNEGGRHLGRLALTQGNHSMQLDVIRGARRMMRNLELWVEGPGIAPQTVGGAKAETPNEKKGASPIFVDATDRILTQRAFVPFDGYKRLYAVSVGNPVGEHFAYDLEAASILRVWRGRFLDASELWIERAESQIAKPNGPSLTLSGKPLLAMFAEGVPRWPDRAAQTAASKGYRIEADGQPTFLYSYVGVDVTDRVAALPDGRGLARTLHITGKPWERSLWLLVAEGTEVKPIDGGYVVGDREYYIDWPKESELQPSIRTEKDRQQLVVHLPVDNAPHDLSYNLIW